MSHTSIYTNNGDRNVREDRCLKKFVREDTFAVRTAGF